MSARVRVAFTMRRADYDDLKRVAAEGGDTVAGYLRRALAVREYVDGRISDGAKFIIEHEGRQSEVIFR